ncbi:FtsJ-like methyltransferase [Drepanopeziza brunnea f. sp. 'multigermtubi' MB_m1]|uniref:rRNA methyltransferase 2, mitochondrial n=1 Tax=Marssonina brunnea f. sp. multigermtubi (strain MB_m1) TaxID=1072389 RepID=K1XMS6_MARBU|nr:FtsJ-like methyltransferase [Drepanopeziza brunnea f. sp. 'multigermtubi' MB_m1]EKD13769.1 FtsJ-like methyltransferase [Drepanopeziza brunnea f. sp. 'multigermtubi' MB_m1]
MTPISTHSAKTQSLQMAYQENLRNTDMIIKDEGARRLRLRILMLENENDELHEQLALSDDRHDMLEQSAEGLRGQLCETQENLRRQDVELRMQGRELVNLKAELSAMNGVTSDSAKVLTEKLSLARELAALKPELEHLKSQALSQQTILAEKLSLQRQVSTLEVELETEKRASKRAAQKTQTSDRETELQNQLDNLNNEIVRERRERDKALKDLEMDLQNQLDEAQKALIRENKGKDKARKEAESEVQRQVEDLQKQLAKEKKGKDKARKEAEAELRSQIEELREELAQEKKGKEKALKEVHSDLQNQVDDLQKELTLEKKGKDKTRKEMEVEFQSQVEELQKDLARERRGKEAHEQIEAELQNQVKELQQELARIKRGKTKASKDADAEMQSQIEELQKELAREKRSKAKASKDAYAELQSRIDELQKELAREERSKDTSRLVSESELQTQIETLRIDLGQEKREREQARKDAEKEMAALQTREAVLESKLDQFRTKLRTTKDTLKQCQADLATAQATITKSGTASKADGPAMKGRKRGALELSTDVEIGTPDGVAVRGKRGPVKRGRADQSMVGEKSLFSITPFLNRTITIAMDTPEQEAEPEVAGEAQERAEAEASQEQPPASTTADENQGGLTPSAAPKLKAQRKAPKSASNILGESEANAKTRKPAVRRAPKKIGTLSQVNEEETGENENPEASIPFLIKETVKPANAAKAPKVQPKTAAADTEDGAKKKKRKLGGGTSLFDEDDGEASKRPVKIKLGAPRLLNKGGLPGPKSAVGMASGFELKLSLATSSWPRISASWSKHYLNFLLLISPLNSSRTQSPRRSALPSSPSSASVPKTASYLMSGPASHALRRAQCIYSQHISQQLWTVLKAPALFPAPQCSIRRPSSSSTRWKSRQGRDSFAREAKVQGLKSRAAFKLLEVAMERTKPSGRIVGIDIIPAQPPKGVSTIQGNFLSPGVQQEVKRFLEDPDRGRPRQHVFSTVQATDGMENAQDHETRVLLPEVEESYIDLERHAARDQEMSEGTEEGEKEEEPKRRGRGRRQEDGKLVDVVLSDMSEPWPQTSGFWKRSLSDPYIRMMNTSGINFKDHAGSMDLCAAALQFAHDTLRVGGHFVCKFYQGSEDKELERQLRTMFKSVHREKPESSRSVLGIERGVFRCVKEEE